MILLELRDFRGCERAALRCDPIALVAGRNASGKSSIAQAAGAALSGQTRVVDGVTKSAAGMLVKIGASSASIVLSGPGGKMRVEWPSCQATSDGEPPHASEIAAGLDSVAEMAPVDRAGVLGDLLHAAPTREEFVVALADLGLDDDEVVAVIWQLITDQGWDQAHQVRKERGAEYKGQWRQVTGVNYGSRIAASWVPKGWAAAEEKLSENDLAAALVKAKADHERAIAAVAVSTAEREQLATEAAKVEERQAALREVEDAQAAVAGVLDAAKSYRAGLLPADAEPGIPCPHCGKAVAIRRVSLVETILTKIEEISAAETKRRRQAIAEADGDIARREGELTGARNAIAAARQALFAATGAKARLNSLASDKVVGNVETAAAAVEQAEARLKAFRQKTQADSLREKIKVNDLILDILAANGLRARKLGRVLDTFNTAGLKPLTEAAGWKAVIVEPDMLLTYGGRRYGLLSTSEQYRVRAALQVAMARLDGSEMLVLDAADVLDAPTRSGLFALLAEAGLPAIVCMTLTRREQVPDIGAAGLGASYWIENGCLETLRQIEEAAA
jgi:hypothetical protein